MFFRKYTNSAKKHVQSLIGVMKNPINTSAQFLIKKVLKINAFNILPI